MDVECQVTKYKNTSRPPTKKKKLICTRLTLSVAEFTGKRSSEGLTEKKKEEVCFKQDKRNWGSMSPRCWNVSEADSCCWTLTFGQHHYVLRDVSEALERIAVIAQPPQTKTLLSTGTETLARPDLLVLSQSEASVSGATCYCASLVENLTVQPTSANKSKHANADLLNTSINSRLCLCPISLDNQSERGFSYSVSACCHMTTRGKRTRQEKSC